MNNYKLIADEAALDRFIEWLPNTSEDEVYYIALFARKKYDDSLKSTKTDRAQLARFVCDKRSIKQRIKQLEAPLGSYSLGDREPTQESLAIYINPNPRSMQKALWEMMEKGLHMARTKAYGFRLDQVTLSCIQKSKSKTFVMDFDIDTKKIPSPTSNHPDDVHDSPIATIEYLIFPRHGNPDYTKPYRVLETRGGFHVLVDPFIANELYGKFKPHWTVKMQQYLPVDLPANQKPEEDEEYQGGMIPIPGCYQGGFVPKFIL